MASLKFEIETWASALEAYDAQDWETSLEYFSKIADQAKIFTNIGLIHASLGEHEEAVTAFRAATSLDIYLGIAYFQAGVSNFLMGKFEEGLKDFEDAFQVLRGNEAINYEQIGLKYQLHGAAVIFNQGITNLNMGNQERGMQLLREAQTMKAVQEHDAIDDAIRDQGKGYSVFCIPVGILYRPNEKKVANMHARDWMGKAKLISATTASKEEFAATRTAPRRPDPPPPQAGLGRSLSAFVPSSMTRNEPTTTRVGRSATVGASAAPPRFLIPPQDGLAMSRKPVIVSPLDTSFETTPSEPLTKSKSVRIAEGSSSPAAKGPPMARRPTLKVVNEDPIELPPSPPHSQRSDSVSSPDLNKSQRLLAAVEEEDPLGRGVQPLHIKPKPSTPANVPEDVDADTMIRDVYNGYLDAGDELYFSSPSATRTALPERSLGADSKMVQRKGSVPSGLNTGPTNLPRPARSKTLPTLDVAQSGASVPASQFSSSTGSGSASFSSDSDLQKIRIKLHHNNDVRGMVAPASIRVTDLLKRVCDKFDCPLRSLRMKFEDEDGTKVSIRDDDDWEMAVGTARMHMSGGEGKLAIWCEDE